jgi:hypothetical protein
MKLSKIISVCDKATKYNTKIANVIGSVNNTVEQTQSAIKTVEKTKSAITLFKGFATSGDFKHIKAIYRLKA